MAAQSVEKIEPCTETNSQNRVKSQTKGDKSKPEMFKVGMVDPSVLKVTEGMKIATLDQVPRMATASQGIIPYKEMHRSQRTLKKAGITRLAVPAQSRENKPNTNETVMLEITENHDWVKDLNASDGLDSDRKSQAVREQPFSKPSASPVLKATGRPEGGLMPAAVKGTEKGTSCDTLRDEATQDGQSVLNNGRWSLNKEEETLQNQLNYAESVR